MTDGVLPSGAGTRCGPTPWLTPLPNDWQLMPLRRLTLSMCDGPFGSLLKSSHYTESGTRVIRLQNIGNAEFRAVDEAYVDSAYFKSLGGHDAQPGDLLVAGLGDENHPVGRACVMPEHPGTAMVKADCFRVRLDRQRVHPQFVAYFLSSPAARAGVAMVSRGATRARINLGGAASIDVPVPRLSQQAAIAEFLDRETAKIDALIARQAEFVARVAEHQRAVISQAIGHGVWPGASVRSTGITTMPTLPAHWSVKRLKHLVRRGTSISYGIVQPGDHDPNGVPFVQTADLTQRRFDPARLGRAAADVARSYPRSRIESGDIILGIRASVGEAAVVPEELHGANLSRGIARIAPSSEICGRFLVLALRAPQTERYWGLNMQGSTFREVSIETVRELPLPVPPLDEQIVIADHVESFEERLRDLRARSTAMIDYLREHRAALITAAVTGRIDVLSATLRQAAE